MNHEIVNSEVVKHKTVNHTKYLSRLKSLRMITRAAFIGVSLVTVLLIATFGHPAAVTAQVPTLPPTWTPQPTPTAYPTLVPPTFDANFPTEVPSLTPRAVVIEQAQLYVSAYFLTKRHAQTVYLARAAPAARDNVSVVTLKSNVLSFDIAANGSLAYGTDSGLVTAAGRAKVWQAPLVNKSPLQPLDMAWSPDGTMLAFSLRVTPKDLASTAKTPVSGVYLWSVSGNPTLIVPDRVAAQDYTLYSVYAWSPDGKYLLMRLNESSGGKAGTGWMLYTFATKTATLIARYTSGDLTVYQRATWMPTSDALILTDQTANNANSSNSAALVTLSGNQQPLILNNPDDRQTPILISTLHFLPDGRLIVLASSAQDQPLRLYTGTLSGRSATLKPISEAFRLHWPGRVLLSEKGFPAYIFDDQYGIVVFEDQRIFAFDPLQIGMGATDAAFIDPSIPSKVLLTTAQVTLPSAK